MSQISQFLPINNASPYPPEITFQEAEKCLHEKGFVWIRIGTKAPFQWTLAIFEEEEDADEKATS